MKNFQRLNFKGKLYYHEIQPFQIRNSKQKKKTFRNQESIKTWLI